VLTIQSWGGIGDTLRFVSQLPVERISRWLRRPVPVIHGAADQLGCSPDALTPPPATIRGLIERCPALTWAGEGFVSRRDHYGYRVAREWLRAMHGGRQLLFPFAVNLTDAEAEGLKQIDQRPVRIGVQSHLLGLAYKKWPLPQWKAILDGLLERFPGASILLSEPAESGADLAFAASIRHAQLSLPQAIHAVQRLDLLVSVDSWSKYIAVWRAIPQVVIVPDPRSTYPQITAETLARHELGPVHWRSEARTVGFEMRAGCPHLTLQDIAALEPARVLAVVDDLLPQIRSHVNARHR
jgi:hypothetical protein